MIIYDILSRLPYFSGLPEDDLMSLCVDSELVEIPNGTTIIEQGTDVDGLYVVATGLFEAVRQGSSNPVSIGTAGPGEVLGEMSLLEGISASATVRAVGDATAVRVPRASFGRLLEDSNSMLAMLHTVTKRLREREATVIQSEKLAALGTHTAGLLHELNNPAAAVRRSAAELARVAQALQSRRPVVKAAAPKAAADSAAAPKAAASGLQLARAENAVIDYLDGHGVKEAADLGPSLVAAGWTVEALEDVALDPSELSQMALVVHADRLADEVLMGATRISELVATVKSYVYLDQAPVQDVDVNRGLEDALTLVRHKLGDINVVRRLDPGLPRIEAYGGELNQAWTNLIDNAIDAAAPTGTVSLTTLASGDGVTVEIGNDGPAIPDEVLARIWEPFYTTKPQGKGTGLGLATTHRIIGHHGGEIEAQTAPGETVFRVKLRRRLPPA